MAFNLLDFIKGEGAVVSFIRSAVETGKKATETLNAFREAAGKIRTEVFYKTFNYFAGPVAAARNYISNIGLNNLPNIERLPESLTKTLKNFSYELKVEVISNETGEAETRALNISSNTLLTKQQAIDEIAGVIEANPNGRYNYSFSAAKVTNVYKNVAGLEGI